MARLLGAHLLVRRHDELHVLLADAAACVLHLDAQRAGGAVGRIEPGADLDVSRLREFHGVADEIQKKLSYALRIDHKRGKAFRPAPYLERGVGVRRPERLDDVPNQLRGRGVDRYDFKTPGLELREVEHMVDEPQERLAADEDGVDRLLALRIRLEAHLQHFGISDHGVERRSYVVAHRREEVASGLPRALLRLKLLLEKMLLAPAQDVEEVDDYRKRRDEQQQLDAHLREHVCAHMPENALHHGRIDRLPDESAERRLGRVAYREADPH